MTQLAVVQIEGVLAQIYESPNGARPIEDAVFLYEGLRRHWKIALVSAEFNAEEAKRWLKLNAFKGYDKLDCKSHLITSRPHQLFVADDNINAYRADGWEVGPLVTAEPAVAERALYLGVTAWLIAHPAYMRPQHRPDAVRTPRAWNTLAEEIQRQQEMKSTDTRMEAEDVIGGSGGLDG